MGIFDKFFGEKNSVDRFVGSTPEEQKAYSKEIERVFKNQVENPYFERPKTPEELEMIEIVNRETDRLREKYGLPEYRVPPENYHVIRYDRRKLSKVADNNGGHFSIPDQEINLIEDDSRILMFSKLFHETVHFKSFASVNVLEPGYRRLGLMTVLENSDVAFSPLNEAVTEALTKRFMRSQERLRVIQRDVDLLERGRQTYGDGKMNDVVGMRVRGDEWTPEKFAYPKEREALDLLIFKLRVRNPNVFPEKEDCFDVFASAMFNGHLLELARHIEKTFGQGAFRRLGEQKTGEELLEFVIAL